ncbi:hypothetical protein BC827DRAFT_888081 [Russula dissimulans]|nr:hypothetical protein BC827DRAFT_888081 [Russula dissimulans]
MMAVRDREDGEVEPNRPEASLQLTARTSGKANKVTRDLEFTTSAFTILWSQVDNLFTVILVYLYKLTSKQANGMDVLLVFHTPTRRRPRQDRTGANAAGTGVLLRQCCHSNRSSSLICYKAGPWCYSLQSILCRVLSVYHSSPHLLWVVLAMDFGQMSTHRLLVLITPL